MSCLCYCSSSSLLSSCFTNNCVVSSFLFCKYSCHFVFCLFDLGSRLFSVLKSAVHFEPLVLLLFSLLAQFLLYKQLCSFRLFILPIFLSFCGLFVWSGMQVSFNLEKYCALWAACTAALLAACWVPALLTIVQFQALNFV